VHINMNSKSVKSRSSSAAFAVSAAVGMWFAGVLLAASQGWLAFLSGPGIAGFVVTTVLVPYVLFRMVPSVQDLVSNIGLERITLLHTWRIVAAVEFFVLGSQGKLPPAFWILAGVGDLIAGSLAATRLRPIKWLTLRRIHTFGMIDFIIAVGTGLTFTLLQDSRMDTIRHLPTALVPFFGVGLSGATHLMAFHLLGRATLPINTHSPVDRPDTLTVGG
jgi:hypothetical protein